jgi:hypothetical protein
MTNLKNQAEMYKVLARLLNLEDFTTWGEYSAEGFAVKLTNALNEKRLIAEDEEPTVLDKFAEVRAQLAADEQRLAEHVTGFYARSEKANCPNHIVVSHRDGKTPWCQSCGLTRTYDQPVILWSHKLKEGGNG